MNSVALTGRLTQNPVVTYTNSAEPMAVGTFTVAVERRFRREGEATADFIRCITFGRNAEFVEKYFSKGMKIEGRGRIQTGSSVNREGRKVYTTDVVLEEVNFGESKNASHQNQENLTEERQDVDESGFMNIPEGIDEELPFN